MNIFFLNDDFFKYFVNYKFPILICSNNNVPTVSVSRPQVYIPIALDRSSLVMRLIVLQIKLFFHF